MNASVVQTINKLPQKNLTTTMLTALDFVVPGEWENVVGFDNTVRSVSGEVDSQRLAVVGQHAARLLEDPDQGYARAMWFYQTVDRVDGALASAALANKVGERIKFLSFIKRLTPKSDMVQTVDLALKVVAELLAYSAINGLPGNLDNIQTFAQGLVAYSGASIMRMAALISIEGLIPLGPDFTGIVLKNLGTLSSGDLEKNAAYKALHKYLPGQGAAGKLGFITNTFSGIQNWLNGFVKQHELTSDKVLDSLKGYIDFSDDALDYVAAFLDLSTNYYTHTGAQSLAQHAIARAQQES